MNTTEPGKYFDVLCKITDRVLMQVYACNMRAAEYKAKNDPFLKSQVNGFYLVDSK